MFKTVKETATEIFGFASIALISNILSPLACCGIPKIKNLLGLKIDEVRVEHFPAEEFPEDWDEDIMDITLPVEKGLRRPLNPINFKRELRSPEILDIKYDDQCVSIDLETNSLLSSSKDMKSYLFGFDETGSGGIGVFILGMPGVIVLLPVILTCGIARHIILKLTDMNADLYLFWRRIKDQLDADTRFKLKAALIKESHLHEEDNY